MKMDHQDNLAKQMLIFVFYLSFDDFETKPKENNYFWIRNRKVFTLIVDSGNCNSAANSQRLGRLT